MQKNKRGFKAGRHRILPIVMVVLNVVISCWGAYFFQNYKAQNREAIRDVANQGVMDLANHMTRQLEQYMVGQNDVLCSTVEYITSTNMSYEDTATLLSYLKNVDGSLLLIHASTCTGEAFRQEAAGAEEISVEDIDVLEAVCRGQGSTSQLQVTGVYRMQEDADNEIAFYQPLTLDGENYVLFYELSVRDIVESAVDEQNSRESRNLIMAEDGTILYYSDYQDGTDRKPDNFFTYIEESYGATAAEAMHAAVTTEASGSLSETAQDGVEWNYVFCRLGSDNEESWIYVNCLQQSEMTPQEEENTYPMIILLFFMTIPWIINVSVIIRQNGNLLKRQETIAEQNTQLAAANKAQSAFISNMSHEIRTPINAVLGMDEMILRESTEEPILEYAYDIQNAGRTLLGIINDILDFTKIEAGKMEIISQEYELSSVVNDLMNMIEVKAREKGLSLQVFVNEDIPYLLYGDELRIKQIILNILTNAVKYTETGSVTFKLGFTKKDEEHIYLQVTVQDTGIGMKPEEMDKLTKPFERLDESRNRNIEGTGLGMSIVTSLLTAMDSRLEVESTYGKGSKFYFSLEQKVADWKKIGDFQKRYQEMKSQNAGKEEEACFHASKARILAVDDTQVNLTVVKGLLKRTGVQLDTAGSGQECLDRCAATQYHVILLDHRMPEMDGVETLRRLRQTQGPNQQTTVIALTANAVSGAAEYYMQEGFNDFLSKPVNGAKLERMLAKYLPEEVMDSPKELMCGIDEAAGLKNCGSKEVYAQVCEEFAQSAKGSIRELGGYLEAGDIENYTIKVHALKSAARLVGAMELSKRAQYLEGCGKNNELTPIMEQTGELLAAYAAVAQRLGAESAAALAELSKEELQDALGAIREFCDAFDFDMVDSIMKKLAGYAMPADFKETYEALKMAVYNVDQSGVDSIIQGYLGGHTHE